MIHKFSLTYELDAPIAIAVAAYLDSEHYIFLHKDYENILTNVTYTLHFVLYILHFITKNVYKAIYIYQI